MNAKQRQKMIASFVLERGEARIDELMEVFQVSRMTIHRHVEELARQGVVHKFHGVVRAQPSSVYESLFSFRATRSPEIKKALVRAALEEIEPGEVILLDDSTTVSAIGSELGQKTPLTVVTNNLGLITSLVSVDELLLVSLGGSYHPTYNAFIGCLCENALAGLRVNTFICSASAVHDGLALIQDPHVTQVKQNMKRAARHTILLVDAEKFEKMALHVFAPITEFDLVITDTSLPEAMQQTLIEAGVSLKLVKPE